MSTCIFVLPVFCIPTVAILGKPAKWFQAFRSGDPSEISLNLTLV